MFPSIFTDELGLDIAEALPVIKGWGLKHVDLRSRIFGRAIEEVPAERLTELRQLLDGAGMKVGCIESSLAKVHLPGAERCWAEAQKLEGVIRAAEALDCPLVRAFFYWQPATAQAGALAADAGLRRQVLEAFAPLAARARQAGLILAFENCGVTTAEVLAVLEELGEPTWGLAWDVANEWHDLRRQADEDAYVQELARRARLIHVKAHGAAAGVGEAIPYDRILQAADNAGMAGPISAETHNPDRTVADLEMSRRVVESIKRAWPRAAPGVLHAPKPAANIVRAWSGDPVRYAVVGLGMGHGRSKQIVETTGCKLVGVCDLVEERARRTGEECGVPWSTDVRRWLEDPSVEVIYVVTETGRHAEIALAALAAGKHVISTKPMEASLAACDAEIRLAEEKGLLLGVDFDRRFVQDTHDLKAAIAAGKFGRLLSGNCALKCRRTMEYFDSNGGWRGTRRWDGGGVLSNQAIHNLDEVAFTAGLPAKVRCNIWTQNHQIEAEDLGSAVWLYANGLVITYYATTNYPHSTWYSQYELEGTEGAFSSVGAGPWEKDRHRWYFNGAWGDQPPVRGVLPWINATDNFSAAVRTGAPLLCPGRDARRSQAILDAMYRSAYQAGPATARSAVTSGGWVDVQPELA